MGTGQRAELHAYASRYVSKYTAQAGPKLSNRQACWHTLDMSSHVVQAWAHSFLNSLARDSELAQAR